MLCSDLCVLLEGSHEFTFKVFFSKIFPIHYMSNPMQEAGKAGITPALYNMGNAFASGQGVTQDFRKALIAYEGAYKFQHFFLVTL